MTEQPRDSSGHARIAAGGCSAHDVRGLCLPPNTEKKNSERGRRDEDNEDDEDDEDAADAADAEDDEDDEDGEDGAEQGCLSLSSVSVDSNTAFTALR